MHPKVLFGVVAVLLVASVTSAAPVWYSITGSQGSYGVQIGQLPNSIAQAYLDTNSIGTTGWATLGLYTKASTNAPALAKAHAAGYLEGSSSFSPYSRPCDF